MSICRMRTYLPILTTLGLRRISNWIQQVVYNGWQMLCILSQHLLLVEPVPSKLKRSSHTRHLLFRSGQTGGGGGGNDFKVIVQWKSRSVNAQPNNVRPIRGQSIIWTLKNPHLRAFHKQLWGWWASQSAVNWREYLLRPVYAHQSNRMD